MDAAPDRPASHRIASPEPSSPTSSVAFGWAVAVLGFLYYATPLAVPLFVPRHAPYPVALAARMIVPGLVALALLPWLRRRPVRVLLAVAALWIVAPTPFGAALVVQAYVAAHARATTSLATGVALVAAKSVATVLYGWPLHAPAVVEWTISVAAIGFATLIGWLHQARRAEAERAAEAEAARQDAWDARVNEARLAERERIAREMHDVVAHRISLIALHSGALAYRLDALPATTDPDTAEAAELARLIQGNAKNSLDELRAMLATLRGAEAPPEPPQPTLGDLDALLADARTAGQRIAATVTGSLEDVPTRVSRNAYRIIQEGLTNARKHAPGSPVTLTVEGGAEGVRLAVANPLADLAAPDRSGAGLGLVGVVERVEQLGGEVVHGVHGPEFRLEAHLPAHREGAA